MRDLEERFGRKHPALEDFKEPLPQFNWLAEAFFRLHRRRQHAENGFQPIPLQEIAFFGKSILHLTPDLQPLFLRCMEETDNAVLYDHYSRTKEQSDKRAEELKKKPRSKRR